VTETDIIEIARDALLTTVIVSGPLMIISLVVGVAIALLQALTQMQEQTLSFVPKLVIMFAAMLMLIPFMLDQMQSFTERMFDRIVAVGLNDG
jgi:flagellar biosynthesis protein FliQ